jgi:Flp pilus assembly protein TadB
MDLGDLLRSLSTNRGAVSTLVVLLIGLVALLVFAPGATAALSARTGTDSLVGRMLGQLRLLSFGDRPFAERVTRLAYRDGKPEGDLELNSDFLLFTRLALGLVLGAAGVLLAIVTGFPLLVIAGPLGFIGPVLYAILYNRNRRAKIALEVPPVLRQLETRVSAGLELRDAFARIAAGRSGGLYAELGWAAAQMANPAVRSYEVLRALDARTGLRLFGPLADSMERASRRGRRDELDVFLAYIGRLIADDEARRDTVIAGIGNKVILGMFPFLLAGLIASVIGPLVFTLGS